MTPEREEPRGWLERLALVKPEERAAALWSAAYFFFLLASYFALRPMREQVGIREGIENLPRLFTWVAIAMVIANPLFSALVSRYPRRKFIPITYRFFELNLLAFFFLFLGVERGEQTPLNWVFFVWVSVFNLFAVTVFRGYMADIFTPDQGKRLFGFIGIGGTLGAIGGAGLNLLLAEHLPPVVFFLISIGLLECAAQCMLRLSRRAAIQPAGARAASGDDRVGGTVLSGIRLAFSSPVLLGIAGLMLLSTISFTFLYVEQATIVKASFSDDDERQRAFAIIDFATQSLTLLLEIFFTGRILRFFGLPLALVALPLVMGAAFVSLHFWPVFAVLACFQVAIRGMNYGLASPAREVLYTTQSREAKYRSKSLIDTFVWRMGDLLGIWTQYLVRPLGWGITLIAVPVAAAWAAIALALGHSHERRVRAAEVARASESAESSAARAAP